MLDGNFTPDQRPDMGCRPQDTPPAPPPVPFQLPDITCHKADQSDGRADQPPDYTSLGGAPEANGMPPIVASPLTFHSDRGSGDSGAEAQNGHQPSAPGVRGAKAEAGTNDGHTQALVPLTGNTSSSSGPVSTYGPEGRGTSPGRELSGEAVDKKFAVIVAGLIVGAEAPEETQNSDDKPQAAGDILPARQPEPGSVDEWAAAPAEHAQEPDNGTDRRRVTAGDAAQETKRPGGQADLVASGAGAAAVASVDSPAANKPELPGRVNNAPEESPRSGEEARASASVAAADTAAVPDQTVKEHGGKPSGDTPESESHTTADVATERADAKQAAGLTPQTDAPATARSPGSDLVLVVGGWHKGDKPTGTAHPPGDTPSPSDADGSEDRRYDGGTVGIDNILVKGPDGVWRPASAVINEDGSRVRPPTAPPHEAPRRVRESRRRAPFKQAGEAAPAAPAAAQGLGVKSPPTYLPVRRREVPYKEPLALNLVLAVAYGAQRLAWSFRMRYRMSNTRAINIKRTDQDRYVVIVSGQRGRRPVSVRAANPRMAMQIARRRYARSY